MRHTNLAVFFVVSLGECWIDEVAPMCGTGAVDAKRKQLRDIHQPHDPDPASGALPHDQP